MAVIYSVTDSKGTTHTRKSVGHSKQIYTHAAIGRPGHAVKSLVKFSKSYQGAVDAARRDLPGYPSIEIRPVTAEVK